MFALQAVEEDVGQCLTEERGPERDETSQIVLQLFTDSVAVLSSDTNGPIAAQRLSLAILDPLSRLVTPVMVSLERKPDEAQVRRTFTV